MIFNKITKELLDLTVKSLQTKLNKIQTIGKIALVQNGWYRVAKYKATAETALKGSAANSVVLAIKRSWGSNVPESHLLLVQSKYGTQEISTFGDCSSERLITKARYTYDVSKGEAFIEIYYNGTVGKANTLHCTVLLGADNTSCWEAVTPYLTSETVDGVTVTATYDIPAKASPVNDIDLTTALAGYLKNTGGSIDGNVVAVSDNTDERSFEVRNSLRRAKFTVNTAGEVYLWDGTNTKEILRSKLNGENTFNGHSTEDLPLNGGGTVSASNVTPLALQSTIGNIALLKYLKSNGDLMGCLGFDGSNNPIFREDNGANNKLLHTGNSNAIVFTEDDTTAPDSNALWAHL